MRDHVRVRLDPGEQARERHHLDDAQAAPTNRSCPSTAAISRGVVVVALDALEEGEVVLERRRAPPRRGR